jgi:hypothetical protein
MEKLLEHFRMVMSLDVGSQYYKSDLHIHTPSSKDAQGSKRYGYSQDDAIQDIQDGYPVAKQIANKIIDKLVAENITVAAFTDHNSPGFIHNRNLNSLTWFELIQEIYLERIANDETHPRLLLLPGVEITTDRIHVLGIFDNLDPYATFKIASLLTKVDIREEEFGEVDGVFGTKSIWEVADSINEIGGICIPAHINAKSSRSLLRQYEPPDMEIERLVQHRAIHVFGVVPTSKPWPDHRTYRSLIENKMIKKRNVSFHEWMVQKRAEVPQHLPALGYMMNSDAHSVDKIGERFSWISLDTPSFRSLASALRNPYYRIAENHVEPVPQVSNQVLGLSFKGGFADGFKLRFTPHFNCVIGRSNTGKTSLMRIIQDTYRGRRLGLRIRDETEQTIDDLAPGLWDLMLGGEIFTKQGSLRKRLPEELRQRFKEGFLETHKTPWSVYVYFSKTDENRDTIFYAAERYHPAPPLQMNEKEDQFRFFRSQNFPPGMVSHEQVRFEEIERSIFHTEVAKPGFYYGRVELGSPEDDYKGARSLLETHLLRTMENFNEGRTGLFRLLNRLDAAAMQVPVDYGLISNLVTEVKHQLEEIYQLKVDFAQSFNSSEIEHALRISFERGGWVDVVEQMLLPESVTDFTHKIYLYLHGREFYDPIVLSFYTKKKRGSGWEEVPFEDLTPSQRSIMALRLLLNSSQEMAPVFIDEPEKWMDNAALDEFYNMRRLRNDQLIIFTGNPNIAVLGNAEQNFVLDVNRNRWLRRGFSCI